MPKTSPKKVGCDYCGESKPVNKCVKRGQWQKTYLCRACAEKTQHT